MDPIWKKLNFKAQPVIYCFDPPKSFKKVLTGAPVDTLLQDTLPEEADLQFVLCFVTQQQQIDDWVPKIAKRLDGDAHVWFAYPKKSSKNYTCDFDRDHGWQIMGNFDLEPVRMVSIDSDWSALRFRKVEFIKKMTRRKSMALSKAGKEKSSGK